MQNNFRDLLRKRWEKGNYLCVGLDSDYAKLPISCKESSIVASLFNFNRQIIEATAEYSCAFKPNIAFYEGYGLAGLEALIKTNRYLRDNYPEIPIILDAKRADIGSTNHGYVKAVEEVFLANAVTLHPYLGKEALEPFLERQDLGVIILCHTSNPGAAEFQEVTTGEQQQQLYKFVAKRVNDDWNYHNNCGLVVGATYPEQLAEVRAVAPNLPLLIPGIGAQGGDLVETVRNGLGSTEAGIIINASRSIIYASSRADFAEAAGQEANKVNQEIVGVVEQVKRGKLEN